MDSLSPCWKSVAKRYFATVSETIAPTSTRYPAGGDWISTAPGTADGLATAGGTGTAEDADGIGA